MFILASVVGVLGMRLVHSAVSPWIPVGARQAAFVIVMAAGLLIGHAWTFHLVDRRGWEFVGLGPAAAHPRVVVRAMALGASAIALPVAVLLAIRWLRVIPGEAGSSLGAAAAAAAVLVPAALWEELFVRGYAFSILRERWGALPAILVTSQVFGWMHLLNAEATIGAVLIVCVAGVFLGLVRHHYESLYAAWAAHLAWNAVLVMVLHATVSGISMTAPDYRVVDAGPDWATGGAWGPEGGLFAAAGLLAVSWYLYRRAPRRPEPGSNDE